MHRSTYLEFNKIEFFLLRFFGDLLWFFKDLVKIIKIKNKRKIEKPLPPHPQTAQGGYLNGFVSLRRLDGRFCSLERKSKFGSKLNETKMTFSLTMEWGESSSSAHARRQPDCHRFNSQQGHQKHICTAPHTYRHNSFVRSVGLHEPAQPFGCTVPTGLGFFSFLYLKNTKF